MSDETIEIDPYDAVLADLYAKRDQIDQAIAAIMNLYGQELQRARGRLHQPVTMAAYTHGGHHGSRSRCGRPKSSLAVATSGC